MTESDLIERAIESAKTRIYKLGIEQEGRISYGHYTKIENQKEVMEVTIKALERMKPKIWIAEAMWDGEFAWKCPSCKEYWALMDGTPQDNEYNFCPKCGQALVEMKSE